MKPPAPTTTSEAQDKWWSQQAIVYFIAAGVPPLAVKMGVTQWSSAKARIGACQTGNHESLELLGVLPFRDGKWPLREAEKKERELHEQFRALQRFPEDMRGHEWFTASPELLSFIRDLTRPPEEFGFVRRVSQMTGPKKKKGPNQSPEPTPTAVTSAAEQPRVPASGAAHL